MGDDDKTPTHRPTAPPAAEGAPTPTPTIDVEADAAGELHESLTGDAAAMVGDEGAPPADDDDQGDAGTAHAGADAPDGDGGICDAQCGTAERVRCLLEPGHEDPAHPAHVKNDHGEALHQSEHVRWAVDVEAAEVAAQKRNRQHLEDAQRAEREAE